MWSYEKISEEVLDQETVKERGHDFKHLVPIIDARIETLQKAKDVLKVLHSLKLEEELMRVAERKVRAGRGKIRGRKYKTKTGPLIVVAGSCPLQTAAANIPGVDICEVNKLNINMLAPGGNAGRFTIFSEEAIEKIKSEELFMNIRAVVQRETTKKETPKEKKVEKKARQ